MQINSAGATARMLMTNHGLIKRGWRFEFDYAKCRAGQCNYRKKVISLSKVITELATEDQVRDTILHEIAHALVGPGHGHTHVWKYTARQIGCNGKRCHDHATPEGKYLGTCPGCSHEQRKHRRTRVACRMCCNKHNHGRFTEDYLISWREV